MNRISFKELIKPTNKKIKVIVEMSGNHQGTIKGAKKFINSAIRSGAEIIKFQVYTPDTITLKSNNKDFFVRSSGKWKKYQNLYNLYKKAHTPWRWIKSLAKILDKKKIAWFASPFDISSVNFLEKLNCPAYKIASPEITDTNLINKIALTKKPVLLSTGVATIKDIDLAIKTIRKYHNNYAILKCVSAYPTPYEDLNLQGINLLKKRYKCEVGFSDHTVDDLASKVAVCLGATIIEKHFKVDNDINSIDEHFSMKLSELKKFQEDLNNIPVCIGKENLAISKSAKQALSGRRSLYVSNNIRKGEKFSNKNIKSVRPSFGLHPKYLVKILGKKSNKDLKIGDRVKLSLIK